jgi:hypothetical protein
MRRAIRLKEYPPGSVIRNIPPDWYLHAKDSTLETGEYIIRTDHNGFILAGEHYISSDTQIVVLGDSIVEAMYVAEHLRMCSCLEASLTRVVGVPVQVLNGGYSGATSLHLLNVFLNKVVPLKPVAVILMTSVLDADVAVRKGDYWNKDCWLEPLVDIDKHNTSRDNEFRSTPDFSSRPRLLSLFQTAGALFDIPVWFATAPHRQLFQGEYVEKTFKDRSDFDAEVAQRRAVNAITRQFALENRAVLFDLELSMIDMHDIYYDMFHHNARGGPLAAKHFIDAGLARVLAARWMATKLNNSASNAETR